MPIVYPIPNLKRITSATGITVSQLSNESGVSTKALYNAIAGASVTSTTCAKICKVLECNPTDLMRTPSVQTALEDIANELQKYRAFSESVYNALGIRLPAIK